MGIMRRLRRQKKIEERQADPEAHKEGLKERILLNQLEKVVNSTSKHMKGTVGQNFLGGCREGFEKNYYKAVKDNKEPTIELLMEDVKPRFLELCERLELKREDFEKLAGDVIAELSKRSVTL